jgi:hypothetical protein
VLYSDDQEASPQRAAGTGDLRLGTKGRLPISPFDIDLALLAAVKIPTADGQRGLGTGQVDLATRLIATKASTEEQRLHFNIGYTWVGKVRGEQLYDVLFIGIAGETNIPVAAAKRFQAVAEVFGTTKKEAGGRTDIRGRVGVRYQLIEDLIFDAALGRSLNPPPEVELFATVGLTWTFDAPWKSGNGR